jgi:hypothetical protein
MMQKRIVMVIMLFSLRNEVFIYLRMPAFTMGVFLVHTNISSTDVFVRATCVVLEPIAREQSTLTLFTELRRFDADWPKNTAAV